MNHINSIIKKLSQYTLYVVLSFVALSCSDKEHLSSESVIGAGSSKQAPTALDQWIKTNITIPYGIEVVYYWDSNSAEVGSYTYPPETEKVKPVLEAIKYLGLQLFQQQTTGGKDFWKGKNPLKIYLYGGENINSEGQELIGNESAVAREMFIYDVNNFDPRNKEKVYVLMRSVFHQLARVLGEVFPYDRYRFSLISDKNYPSSSDAINSYGLPKDGIAIYTLQYYPKKRDLSYCRKGIPFQYFDNEQDCIKAHEAAGIDKTCFFCEYPQENANKEGFFTFHSRLSPESDFAEVVSVFLTNSPSKMENAKRIALIPRSADTEEEEIIAKEKAEEAFRCLNEKQQFVENYFRNEVGISIKKLQLLSLQRMHTFLNKE